MRIALIRREFITHLDGVNRFIANLADGLKALGNEVFIVSWSYQGVNHRELARWFREAHGLDHEFEVHVLRGPEKRDKWTTMMYDWYTKGSRLLRELDVDIAFVNGVVPLRFKPKVAIAHGPLINISKTERLLLRALYRMYDYVICASKRSQEEYKGITKCNEIIPLPLKLKNFKPRPLSEREDVIVHIGTRSIKNPWVSVKVIEKLREIGCNVNLVIIGSRSAYVEELCRGKSFVTPMFNVSEKEKNEILCRAKALILPSSSEAFPYVSLEAMACGTPPIVSQAVPDDVVIHGYNGLKVNSLNPMEYAKALEHLLRNKDLWLNLSRNALEYVKRFDHIEIARKYLQVSNSIRTARLSYERYPQNA